MRDSLDKLQETIVRCDACPRLNVWRRDVAIRKRKAYAGETYWGRPVPSFGDPRARILLVGLAPGAHGAHRTGRMFTGDRSGEWLYRALHKAGLASQAASVGRDDGLRLTDVYITAVVRCAPPGNRPTPEERDQCLPYLARELDLLGDVRILVALGAFAWEGILAALSPRGFTIKPRPRFGHGAESAVGPYRLIGCFHPSQQNTFTGRLTEPMLDEILERAKRGAQAGSG